MNKLMINLSALALLLAPSLCLSAGHPDACVGKTKRSECTGAGHKNECIWNAETSKCKTYCDGADFLTSTREADQKRECEDHSACKWHNKKCTHKE